MTHYADAFGYDGARLGEDGDLGDTYEGRLRAQNGRCSCPELRALHAQDIKTLDLRKDADRLANAIDRDGCRDWGVYWDHKQAMRIFNENVLRYWGMVAKLFDAGHLKFRLHHRNSLGYWEIHELLSWEKVELAFETGLGPVAFLCAHCGQQIDISSSRPCRIPAPSKN